MPLIKIDETFNRVLQLAKDANEVKVLARLESLKEAVIKIERQLSPAAKIILEAAGGVHFYAIIKTAIEKGASLDVITELMTLPNYQMSSSSEEFTILTERQKGVQFLRDSIVDSSSSKSLRDVKHKLTYYKAYAECWHKVNDTGLMDVVLEAIACGRMDFLKKYVEHKLYDGPLRDNQERITGTLGVQLKDHPEILQRAHEAGKFDQIKEFLTAKNCAGTAVSNCSAWIAADMAAKAIVPHQAHEAAAYDDREAHSSEALVTPGKLAVQANVAADMAGGEVRLAGTIHFVAQGAANSDAIQRVIRALQELGLSPTQAEEQAHAMQARVPLAQHHDEYHALGGAGEAGPAEQ